MYQSTLEGQRLLDNRIREAEKIIRLAIKKATPDPVIVNYSGGKDSLVLLHLVKKITENFVCAFMETGIHFEGLLDYIKITAKKNDVDILVSYPCDHKGDFWKRIDDFKKFPTMVWLWCNRDLKIRPQKKMLDRELGKKGFYKLTGVRRYESTRRARIYAADAYIKKDYQVNGDFIVNPILNWTDLMVLQYIKLNEIIIDTNPLYEKYGVSSCMWCPYYQASIYRKSLSFDINKYDRFIEWEEKLKAPSVQEYTYLGDLKKEIESRKNLHL